MKKIITSLSALVFLSCVSFQSSAQVLSDSTQTADVFDFSLEELLNLEITVASKKAEKVSDAPGMVTVYSNDDIQNYGYYTLKDLANITSGYSSFAAYGETNLETRGVKASSWNVNKHLLMVDGIPMNHSRANSAPLENQMSLFFADRVEFLKGPGSALYGTSAFYGVMSITPKSLEENGVLAESKLSIGDLGNSKRLMSNALVKNDVGQMRVSATLFKKGFSGDSLGATATKGFNFNNDNSIFLNTAYEFTDTKLKGLGVGFVYSKRNSHGGEFWGNIPSPVNDQTWEQLIPYVKYQRELSDKLSFDSYMKYDQSKEHATFGASWAAFGLGSAPLSGFSFQTNNFQAQGELTYTFNETSSLIGGLNYDTRREVGSPASYTWNLATAADTSVSKSYTFNHIEYDGTIRVNVASAYAQYRKELNVLKGMILTAGGRFDYGFTEDAKYTQFSPRVGIVQRLTDKLNVKALYGQALRVPGVKELGSITEIKNSIRKNGGTGNVSDISEPTPEVIKSFEVGINYNTKNFSGSLAGFYNVTTDPLGGRKYSYTDKDGNPLDANYESNLQGQVNASGFEVDLKYAINKDLRIMLNHSYAKAIVNDTIDFVDVPTQKTNAAVTYGLSGKVKLVSTAVVRHMWGMTTTDGAYDPTLVDMNSKTEVKGFTMLDLNFKLPIVEQFGVELQVRNVLDTKWKQPSLLGQGSMIPLQGRNFLGTVYATF